MIGTEIIEDIISSALFSSYIADEKPLSLLISAAVESGKTELMAKYKDNQGVKYLTDATAYSIWRDMLMEIEGGEVRHFIFPDLLTPLSKSRDTVNSFVMCLTNLSEEGVAEVHSGFLAEGGIKLSAPTSIGIISGIPPSDLSDHRRRWTGVGFMSRMLPVSYRYSQDMAKQIKEAITERQYVHESPTTLSFPTSQVRVALPLSIAQEVLKLEENLMKDNEFTHTYGFRLLKQLQRLVMSYALMKGRDYVSWSDFLVLRDKMAQYLNLKYNKL